MQDGLACKHLGNLYNQLEFGLFSFTVGKTQCHHTLRGFNFITYLLVYSSYSLQPLWAPGL